MMKLQQYNFTIQHRPGKLNNNADALSRMYEQEEDQFECFIMEFGNTIGNEDDMEGIETIETNDDWEINEHWTDNGEEKSENRSKICLTCGHRKRSKTWNKKHYRSEERRVGKE